MKKQGKVDEFRSELIWEKDGFESEIAHVFLKGKTIAGISAEKTHNVD